MFEFKVVAKDGVARVGELATPHGTLTTPCFMPVGTHGAVKGVSPAELQAIHTQIILGNTYHLYLRPGDKLIHTLGGLHAFTGWNGPMLTDSGGFQVFSLGGRGMNGQVKTALRQVSEDGITFRSHLDGSSHLFTPEKSLEIQHNLGADIIMAFDQPVYGLTNTNEAQEAMERTHRWLLRSKEQWQGGNTNTQALFGIVQGGIHTDLHRESAAFVAAQNLPGNAIGGLSVGEGKAEMWEATADICSLLPTEKPRYFMGLGDPLDLIEATLRGVDMYDCVAPSRLARHGVVWQVIGEPGQVEAFWSANLEGFLHGPQVQIERWNLLNRRFRTNPQLLTQLPENLPKLSFATLHHYLKENEMLGYRLLTLANIAVLNQITLLMRQAIVQGKMASLRDTFTFTVDSDTPQ